MVFAQALKSFLKAQQWPGAKRTRYLLYIKQIYVRLISHLDKIKNSLVMK